MDAYKNRLEEQRGRLMREIASEEKPTDFGSDIDDSSEEASEAEEFANRTALAQTQKNELLEVERALQKIEGGTYGICDNCKNEIEEEALSVAPESALCTNCKKKA